MLSTMKLLTVFVLSCSVFSIKAQCDPNLNACRDDAPIATIECTGSTCTGWPDGMDDSERKTIDANVCRHKCKEHADSEADTKCKFYRWEHGHDLQTTCSFLSECGEKDPYCDGIKCITGQLGCNKDGDTVTPCRITEKTVWNDDMFHVICTDTEEVEEGGFGDINIYNDNITSMDIPDGTVCSTIRMCAAWGETEATTTTTPAPNSADKSPLMMTNGVSYFRKLAIKCDGVEDGTWKKMENTGSDALSEAMIGDGGTTIVEQECTSTCPPLLLTEYAAQNWADLICDTPLVEDKLEEPNSCILLCDNHLKMSIDCQFTEEGEKQWQKGDGTALREDADVTC